jgi:Zn-dependent protease with chaperone function
MTEETSFSGGVFNDAIEGGRAGAEIELQHDRVVATTTDDQQFAVRYDDCQIEVGGFNGRMVFCRNSDRSLTIFCDHKKFATALAWSSGGLLDEQLQVQHQQKRSQSRRGRWVGLACVVFIAVALYGAYFGIRVAADAAVQAVPISVDQQIGKHAFSSMDVGGPEVDDPVVTAAIQQIVTRLAPHAAVQGLSFDVHVVDSPELNAFALPGGTIVVYTGLIASADHPDEVAGVIAHEMAHATMRHGLRQISRSLGLAAAVNVVIGDVEGIVVAGAEMFQLATINSYSRGQENEADAEGVRMLHAAGIDPRGLAQFFETMKEETGDLPSGLSWISTHPEHDARIANVRGLVAELSPRDYKPIDVDWGAVQQRLPER